MIKSKHKIQVSIVIATHESAQYLPKVLSALEIQTYSNFEVIIVNNNISKKKLDFLPNYKFDLKLIHEAKIGLSIARNTGITHAKGQYIAFLDDDAVPKPNWLAELIFGFSRFNASLIGGAVELIFFEELPRWFDPELRIFLSELLYDRKDIESIDEAQYVVGANMCVDKRVFSLFGGFNESFGRSGRLLRSSEELELCRRIQKANCRVSFVYSAQVRHFVSPERMKKHFFILRAYWQGRSDAMLEKHHGRPILFGKRNNWINLKVLFIELIRLFRLGKEANRFLQRVHTIREFGYLFQYLLLSFSKRLVTWL